MNKLNRELQAIMVIAYRDFTKLMRDRPRILISLIFPIIFIGALGGMLQASIGDRFEFSWIDFVFTGVFAQTLFQSTAAGIISLIEDRENDFSQEIFVSPISRYSIIIGKIIGETLVSYVQIVGVIIFGLILQVPLTIFTVLLLFVAGLAAAMLGGAFGVMVLASLSSQRSANQIFPFLIFPQFFVAGIFTPLTNLPLPLVILSRIAPLTYAVDFIRGIYYMGKPEFDEVVIWSPALNFAVMVVMFIIMISIGTFIFVRNERNR